MAFSFVETYLIFAVEMTTQFAQWSVLMQHLCRKRLEKPLNS